jgi:RNA-binding protein
VVMIGGAGLTEPVLAEIDRALNAHSLIKIRLLDADRDERQVLMDAICRQLGVQPVQAIGKLLIVYRKLPEAPPRERITLRPRAEPAKPGRWRGPIRNATAPRGRPPERGERTPSDFRPPAARSFGDRDATPRRSFGDRDAAPRRAFGDRDAAPRRAFGDRPSAPRRFGERDGAPPRPGHAPRAISPGAPPPFRRRREG